MLEAARVLGTCAITGRHNAGTRAAASTSTCCATRPCPLPHSALSTATRRAAAVRSGRPHGHNPQGAAYMQRRGNVELPASSAHPCTLPALHSCHVRTPPCTIPPCHSGGRARRSPEPHRSEASPPHCSAAIPPPRPYPLRMQVCHTCAMGRGMAVRIHLRPERRPERRTERRAERRTERWVSLRVSTRPRCDPRRVGACPTLTALRT